MKDYLRRLYLYALALAVEKIHQDSLQGTIHEQADHYEVLMTIKVPKNDEGNLKGRPNF